MKNYSQWLILFTFVFNCFSEGHAQTFSLKDTSIQVGDSLIHAVYFDYNGSGILNESKPFLDSMIVFMTTHDSIQLEVSNHTDHRGSDKYNLRLSEMRAKTIRQYLIHYGKFKEDKITAVGYGEYRPIIPISKIEQLQSKEEREKAYSVNRRVVFKIVSTSYPN